MKYGAKMLQWAPFAAENAEPAGALPNYGTPINLGELNKVTDNPVFNEAKAFGNNALARYVAEFKEVSIDVEILDMTNTHAAAVLGASIPEGEGQDLHFGAEDNPPYGGLGFYVNELLPGNKKAYKGVFYPKVKATMQGAEYSTKGDSITLTGCKLHFLGAICSNGDWKLESDYFDTEAEAAEWVNNKVKAATA